jgi:hypothetical protein
MSRKDGRYSSNGGFYVNETAPELDAIPCCGSFHAIRRIVLDVGVSVYLVPALPYFGTRGTVGAVGAGGRCFRWTIPPVPYDDSTVVRHRYRTLAREGTLGLILYYSV